jgi:diaminopimelate decarboxylase
MELVNAIVEQYFDRSNGLLQIQGLSITEIADNYATPLFVYNAEAIESQLTNLRQALPARFGICYSVKANPNPIIMKLFLAQGCGLEIASIGEYQRAIQAGCPPEKILFAGPGKTEAELTAVISQGIGEIHAESLTELERLGRISRHLGKQTQVALRVNPTSEAQGGAMQMGGKPAPFGIDEENLEQALGVIAGESHLHFHGIHLFVGTQVLNHEVLLTQYRKGLAVARQAAQYLNMPLSTLDFGGGLGIPYFANETSLDLEGLRSGLAHLMTEIEGDLYLANTQFLVEPGRFLVGPCGLYVARVNDLKLSRGKKFAILDGGMHHHLAASGNLGQVIKRNYPIAVLNKLEHPVVEDAIDVVGPLCTPLDTLARNISLPELEIGDLVGIFQSGAYARAASPMGFLSHPTPPEVWVERGQAILINERLPYAH